MRAASVVGGHWLASPRRKRPEPPTATMATRRRGRGHAACAGGGPVARQSQQKPHRRHGFGENTAIAPHPPTNTTITIFAGGSQRPNISPGPRPICCCPERIGQSAGRASSRRRSLRAAGRLFSQNAPFSGNLGVLAVPLPGTRTAGSRRTGNTIWIVVCQPVVHTESC